MHKHWFSTIILLALILYAPVRPTRTLGLTVDLAPEEKAALIALYQATDGDHWTNKTGWLSSSDPCSWFGVACGAGNDMFAHVNQLSMSTNNLSGTLPPSAIGSLPYLWRLYFPYNHLSGQIPVEIGLLTKLTHVDLSYNQLEGPIPHEIGNLTKLWIFRLDHNELTGDIPTEIGNLVSAGQINFSQNQLTGLLPSTFGNLTGLGELDLHWNDFTGSIPDSFANMVTLYKLDLSYDHLSGILPAWIGDLTKMKTLDLGYNELGGTLPFELGSLTSLEELALNYNGFSGPIPFELGNLTNLLSLNLADNELSGSIPISLGNLVKIQMIRLWHNQLTGSIPSEFGNLHALEELSLEHNQLSGQVPASLGSDILLRDLGLNDNLLAGALPDTLIHLLSMDQFTFDKTELCEPGNIIFQNWLSIIRYLSTTGKKCDADPIHQSVFPSGGRLDSPNDATAYSFGAGVFSVPVTVTHAPQNGGGTLQALRPGTDGNGAQYPTLPLWPVRHTYSLTAVDSGGNPIQPSQPYSLTIQYSRIDAAAVAEASLGLYSWDGSQWVKEPTSQVDTTAKTITAAPNHMSTWAVLGTPIKPSFTKGPDQVVDNTDGEQSIANWATNISVPIGQEWAFLVSTQPHSLFSALPDVDNTGTLTFTPQPGAQGTALVTVFIEYGNYPEVVESDPQTFTITVQGHNVYLPLLIR